MLQFGLIHRVMYTSCDNGIINNKCINVNRVLIDHMIRRKGQDTDILSECVFCASLTITPFKSQEIQGQRDT